MSNIAITGVGGGVGQSILKSLSQTEYNLIALDGDILAAGLYAASKSHLIPYAKNNEFIPQLLKICKQEKISLLFPGLDAELMPLSMHRDDFTSIGTTVIVSSPDVISISDNKQTTYDRLTSCGIKVPFTTGLENFSPDKITFPVIVKQKVGGARSKNVFLIKTIIEWETLLETIINEQSSYIVQEYIEGEEYTCGSINLNNNCKGVIVMKRILRDGDTHKCFTEKNPIIEETVRNVCESIKPFGACNVQLRMKGNTPFVFEINARCSGTTASRTLCGFNEPNMIANYLLKGVEPTFEIQEKTILRYWKELVVENEDIANLKANKSINLSLKKHL